MTSYRRVGTPADAPGPSHGAWLCAPNKGSGWAASGMADSGLLLSDPPELCSSARGPGLLLGPQGTGQAVLPQSLQRALLGPPRPRGRCPAHGAPLPVVPAPCTPSQGVKELDRAQATVLGRCVGVLPWAPGLGLIPHPVPTPAELPGPPILLALPMASSSQGWGQSQVQGPPSLAHLPAAWVKGSQPSPQTPS